MNEYEVELDTGITTTLQLTDEDAKAYRATKKVGTVKASEEIHPERRVAEADREVAADAETPKRGRTAAKETR